jgi:hypothetical protein
MASPGRPAVHSTDDLDATTTSPRPCSTVMATVDGWPAVADLNGLLSTSDALAAGLSKRDLARMADDGQVVHLARGWYCLPSAVSTPDDRGPWERRRLLHVARTRAEVRAVSGRAVASHHSALVRNDLPAFAADLRQVHLTRIDDTNSRRRTGLTVHQCVPGSSTCDGVIDISTAVVQSGVENGPMAALVAGDAALHRGLVGLDHLMEACTRVTGPRTVAVRSMLHHTDARAESPGETRLRWALWLMGYHPVSQFRVEDGAFLAVVDFLLEEARVAIEFDGFVKYGRRSPFTLGSQPADVVAAEKVREDHVRELDYGFVRVIWSDMHALPALNRRVDAAVQRAHRLVG